MKSAKLLAAEVRALRRENNTLQKRQDRALLATAPAPLRGVPDAAPLSKVGQPVPPAQIFRPDASSYGVSGTAITSGFIQDLGEYNASLMGRLAVDTYEQMRRGDAQVRAILQACKLPIRSAKWDVKPSLDSQMANAGSIAASAAVSSNRAGKATAAKAQAVADFVKENLFGGLEFQTSTGGWVSQTWTDV